jgi:nitrite reductase/ring-hydroxylating ferredoxin subunit
VDTRTLPWDWYVSADVLAQEQERVFKRAWTYACPAEWVTEPGTYVACNAGDVPLVVVRGRDGALRAFVNVCRHRGSVIASGRGRRETLQCPYHAWTYDLDGTLRKAPRSERESDFTPEELSLRPALVDTWGPFVFVNADAGASPLGDTLGPLPSLVDADSLVFRERSEYAVRANWKVAIENYLECYHCPVAHQGFSRLVETSPDAYVLEATDGVLSQFGKAKDGEGECQFHLVWPTLKINVFPGFANLSIGRVWPAGTERTEGFLDYFFGPGVSEAQARELIELDEQVGLEDRALVEGVQRGVRSGAIESGHLLLDSETLIRSFQNRLFAALS